MAELKIKADSGGGTVSFKGPATTTSNAAVQLTLPVDDGTTGQYLKTDCSGALSWATVSTDPTTTSGTNNFTVADGDLVIGTAGHGISFAATSDGTTMSSELLDDYEEGSFTATAHNSVTLSVDTLYYTKVGNLVHISGYVSVNSDNSNAVFYINNLPFTSNSYSVPSVHTNNWDLPSGAVNVAGYSYGTNLRFRTDHDNSGPQQLNADSGAEIFISHTYRAS